MGFVNTTSDFSQFSLQTSHPEFYTENSDSWRTIYVLDRRSNSVRETRNNSSLNPNKKSNILDFKHTIVPFSSPNDQNGGVLRLHHGAYSFRNAYMLELKTGLFSTDVTPSSQNIFEIREKI